jgi:hypothetical protein
MQKIFTWIVSIGADQNDDDDLRLKKSLLVVCALPFALLDEAASAAGKPIGFTLLVINIL